jgi:hypothetical protein
VRPAIHRSDVVGANAQGGLGNLRLVRLGADRGRAEDSGSVFEGHDSGRIADIASPMIFQIRGGSRHYRHSGMPVIAASIVPPLLQISAKSADGIDFFLPARRRRASA